LTKFNPMARSRLLNLQRNAERAKLSRIHERSNVSVSHAYGG
jgi:hypothetical protein